MGWWEPLAAYWSRKKLERLQSEQACRLLESGPALALEDGDADRWSLVAGEKHGVEPSSLREEVRRLVETHPFARNALTLYRNYVVGAGMQYEVVSATGTLDEPGLQEGRAAPREVPPHPRPLSPVGRGESEELKLLNEEDTSTVQLVGRLWRSFLDANQWETGNRRDWEFCLRTWRDGECFVRLFRQPVWPPRMHFVDPERVTGDAATELPDEGIATQADNVEIPVAFRVQLDRDRAEVVPAERMLHCKIGVDGNVKRGQSLLAPVVDSLKKYQRWLEVELIHRQVASSIVLVRKHAGTHPAGITHFADWNAQSSQPLHPLSSQDRQALLKPGTLIDAQGYDLQYLSPDSHFDDATILGRRLLLSVAAGVGLPEFMLTADAANANYSSTLVSEGPAVRLFTSWQAFFIGQWQTLFQMVMRDAVRLGLLTPAQLRSVRLRITPPTVAVRNRKEDAEADVMYFDRGALSRRELARRDHVDPAVMEKERAGE
jgi:capsid protein